MKVKELHNSIISKLEAIYESREAENISFMLLEHLGISRSMVLLNENMDLDDKKIAAYLKRLLKHEPIQQILGYAWFYNRKFQVNTHTLIPRPETEELVYLILNSDLEQKLDNEVRILDVGTGTGCIPVTLKKERPHWHIDALDISKDALGIAKKNADLLGAEVSFFQSDVLKDNLDYSSYNVIISNPPYISENEANKMHKNVLKYEPSQALFVKDNNPLLFYECIVETAKTNQGIKNIFFEVSEYFGTKVVSIIENALEFNVELHQDLQGKDRIVYAFKN